MENFIEHLIFVCIAGLAIGTVLCVWTAIWEGINKLTDNKLSDAIVKFMTEDNGE